MGIYTKNTVPYQRRTLLEMLVPYLMYTQRYDDIAEKIGNLGDLSVIWNNLLSPTRDEKTWNMVNDYNNRLGDTILDMQNGRINLNEAMNKLQNLKREYNEWGTAVDNAYKQRLKFIEEQHALALLPGGYHVTRPAESFSIDELIANPAASYEALSEKELYDRGLNAAQAASGRRFSTYEATRFKGEYNMLVNQQGYSLKDAAKFLANKYNIPELGAIFDNLTTEYNLDRFGNRDNIDRIQLDQSIFNGILDGMTGGRSETKLGERKEPKFEDPFAGKGGKSSSTQVLPLIPLSPIIQGKNEPTGEPSGDEDFAFMKGNKVYTIGSNNAENELNSIKEEYNDYLEAINNTTVKLPYYPPITGAEEDKKKLEKQGWRIENGYMVRDKKYDFFDKNGNYKGSKTSDSFIYNGKEYSPKRFDELLEIINTYKESENKVQDIYKQYSFLNNTTGIDANFSDADVINIGNQLNNSVLQQNIVDFPYKASMDALKNIVSYFNTVLTDEEYFPRSRKSQNGIFAINDRGELIDKVYTPSDDPAVLIFKDSGKGSQMGFRQNGQDYAWRGDAIINQITKEYDGMKAWLTNFTNKGVGIGSKNGKIIIANTKDNKDDIYNQINGLTGISIPGTPYYGFVVYDQNTGDLIKIITDTPVFTLPNAVLNPLTNKYQVNYGSHIIAMNTLGNQLTGQTDYIDQYLMNYVENSMLTLDEWLNKKNN